MNNELTVSEVIYLDSVANPKSFLDWLEKHDTKLQDLILEQVRKALIEETGSSSLANKVLNKFK